MPSTKEVPDSETRSCLLSVARRSIQHTLATGDPWLPDLSEYPAELHVQRATFTTLLLHGRLRGCIGTTEPVDPLIMSTARNAYAAAFRDPRFQPVTNAEFEAIHISLSLLTPAEPLEFADENDLVRQLRPGNDGLIIMSGEHKATFLPSVWETLPDASAFLQQLKLKGNLPAQQPPQRAWRYTTITISED